MNTTAAADKFGGMSPWAEGEARDPSPPKRARVHSDHPDHTGGSAAPAGIKQARDEGKKADG